MRVFFIILLIAMSPLRGFASVGMQVGMAEMALQQAVSASERSDSQPQESNAARDSTSVYSSPLMSCDNGQCSMCDICYSQIGQASASVTMEVRIRPPVPQSPTVRFASADAQSALKPPLSLF